MSLQAPLITLTSDFGLRDYFVGAMKGVLLREAPSARLIDIAHGIPRHDVLSAAFVLGEAWPYFPSGSIHLAVVDPGVGTNRRKLVAEVQGQAFVAPDNGLLSYILQEEQCRVYAVEGLLGLQFRKSPTFAGRDHFAPIAALLAKGRKPSDLGNEIFDAKQFKGLKAEKTKEGFLGRILYFDRFGNAITNVRTEDLGAQLEDAGGLRACLKGQELQGLKESYEDGADSGPGLILNSSGYLEVFLSRGNARQNLKLNLMDEVLVYWAKVGLG